MISVLTVNYRSSGDLAILAASLREHAGDHAAELVITNNSIEDPVRLTSDSTLTVLLEDSPNNGFAAGINKALRASSGEYLMIANPDVRITADTFNQATAYLREQPNAGIVLPLLRYPDGEIQLSVRKFYTWPIVIYARSPLRMVNYQPGFFREYLNQDMDRSAPTPVDWGLGAAMFMRREDVSGDTIFDERFFTYFEDVDLCYRMWKAGRPVMYCPHIECIHAHRRHSSNPLSKAGWQHLRSLFKFVAKHGGLPQRPQRSRRS